MRDVLFDKTMVRVFEKIRIDPVSGCWLWTGTFRGSYPAFSFLPEEMPNGFPATRAIRPWLYRHWVTGIPYGQQIPTPSCNPACVAPAHMWPKFRKPWH